MRCFAPSSAPLTLVTSKGVEPVPPGPLAALSASLSDSFERDTEAFSVHLHETMNSCPDTSSLLKG